MWLVARPAPSIVLRAVLVRSAYSKTRLDRAENTFWG